MNEVIIQKDEKSWLICVLEDNKIVEKYEIDFIIKPRAGDIYLGKIKRINNKSHAVFVDIGFKKMGFLEVKNTKNYSVGEYILVKIKKEELPNKGAKLSDNVNDFDKADFPEKIGLIQSPNQVDEFVYQNLLGETTQNIYTNDSYVYEQLLKKTAELKIEVIFKEKANFIDEFGMLGQLEDFQKRKIWLKSGGYLVIDKTEALWVIDVNSGKYEGKKGEMKEEYTYKVNAEASVEIIKQIRLRNLGGIIVVDFINMESDENRQKIIKLMKKEANKDRCQVKIYKFSELGLLEIARKKL